MMGLWKCLTQRTLRGVPGQLDTFAFKVTQPVDMGGCLETVR